MYDFVIKEHNKSAVFYGERVYSYADLLRHSTLYAKYYHQHTTQEVERVMYVSKNTPEYTMAILAAFRIGATAVPVDVTSTKKELSYMINDARPQIIYCEAESRELVEECVAAVAAEQSEVYTPHIFTPDMVDLTQIESVEVEPIAAGAPDDVMVIIYTSGTTGSPKGVMLIYANLWYNVDAVSNQVKIFTVTLAH